MYSDASHLHQVMHSLVLNASAAMGGSGAILVTTGVVELAAVDLNEWRFETGSGRPGTYVRISVSDDGEGIAPDEVDLVFEPFYTTKMTGQGHGLGLAMVMGIAHSHQGAVHVASSLGAGSCVSIALPIAP